MEAEVRHRRALDRQPALPPAPPAKEGGETDYVHVSRIAPGQGRVVTRDSKGKAKDKGRFLPITGFYKNYVSATPQNILELIRMDFGPGVYEIIAYDSNGEEIDKPKKVNIAGGTSRNADLKEVEFPGVGDDDDDDAPSFGAMGGMMNQQAFPQGMGQVPQMPQMMGGFQQNPNGNGFGWNPGADAGLKSAAKFLNDTIARQKAELDQLRDRMEKKTEAHRLEVEKNRRETDEDRARYRSDEDRKRRELEDRHQRDLLDLRQKVHDITVQNARLDAELRESRMESMNRVGEAERKRETAEIRAQTQAQMDGMKAQVAAMAAGNQSAGLDRIFEMQMEATKTHSSTMAQLMQNRHQSADPMAMMAQFATLQQAQKSEARKDLELMTQIAGGGGEKDSGDSFGETIKAVSMAADVMHKITTPPGGADPMQQQAMQQQAVQQQMWQQQQQQQMWQEQQQQQQQQQHMVQVPRRRMMRRARRGMALPSPQQPPARPSVQVPQSQPTGAPQMVAFASPDLAGHLNRAVASDILPDVIEWSRGAVGMLTEDGATALLAVEDPTQIIPWAQGAGINVQGLMSALGSQPDFADWLMSSVQTMKKFLRGEDPV